MYHPAPHHENEHAIKGAVRAADVVHAFETSGLDAASLTRALLQEAAHARAVYTLLAVDQPTRDEWRARAGIYRAAIRRLAEAHAEVA